MKSRGRPKSKVTTVEFLQAVEKYRIKFDLYLFHRWLDEKGIRIYDGREPTVSMKSQSNQIVWDILINSDTYQSEFQEWEDNLMRDVARNLKEGITPALSDYTPKYITSSDESNYYDDGFVEGVFCGLQMAISVVFPTYVRYRKSASEYLKHYISQTKKTPEPGSRTEEEMQVLSRKIPNELMRKVRVPAYSRGKILRFRRMVKEYDGLPTVQSIGKALGVSKDEVLRLVREAGRQKIKIEIGVVGEEEILII
jgi:hypothetical protein